MKADAESHSATGHEEYNSLEEALEAFNEEKTWVLAE